MKNVAIQMMRRTVIAKIEPKNIAALREIDNSQRQHVQRVRVASSMHQHDQGPPIFGGMRRMKSHQIGLRRRSRECAREQPRAARASVATT